MGCYRTLADCTSTTNSLDAASVAECCLSAEGMFVETSRTCEICIGELNELKELQIYFNLLRLIAESGGTIGWSWNQRAQQR